MKQKRSGFTLIELLAVIIILAIIAVIAIPIISSNILESRKSAMYRNTDAMETSAELYLAKNQQLVPTNNGDSIFVTLKELEESGSLTKVRNAISIQTCNRDQSGVKVTKNNDKYSYETTLLCADNEDNNKLGIYTAYLPKMIIRKDGIYSDQWFESVDIGKLFDGIKLTKVNTTKDYSNLTKTLGTKQLTFEVHDSNSNKVMLVKRELEVVDISEDKNLSNEVTNKANYYGAYKNDEIGSDVPNYLIIKGLEDIPFRIVKVEKNGNVKLVMQNPIYLTNYTDSNSRTPFYPGGYNEGCPSTETSGCGSYAIKIGDTLYNSKAKDIVETFYNEKLKPYEELFVSDYTWNSAINVTSFPNEKNEKTIIGPVGMLNQGEAYNTINNKNSYLFTGGDTAILSTSSPKYRVSIIDSGWKSTNSSLASNNLYLKASVVLKPNIEFTTGIGTKDDPYIVEMK